MGYGLNREVNKGTAFFIITSMSFIIAAFAMKADAQEVGHAQRATPVVTQALTNQDSAASGVSEKEEQSKLPHVVVDRNKVISEATEEEVLVQAKATCEGMLRDQAWVFYGFWASERNASDLQKNFPHQLEKYSRRHLEHTIACKRVTTRAAYGIRKFDSKEALTSTTTQNILWTAALPIGILATLIDKPILKSNESEALSVMEAVCEPRPKYERQALEKLFSCVDTQEKIDRSKRFAQNAARNGDQEQLKRYNDEVAELQADRPEGCELALQESRTFEATEFVKAQLDSCQEI